MNLIEFYPTPESLLDKILEGVDWRKVRSILEPSAGRGDIVNYILTHADKYPYYNSHIDIDCVEMDNDLAKILKGNNQKVVHDNFLTYATCKNYDMIIMNPPFSEGDKHLSKALDLQEKTGGDVICILNAETIRNPYTNLRKELIQRLDDASAEITFMKHEFKSAARSTDVEIAVVKVHFEKPEYVSDIYENLKKKAYEEKTLNYEETDLAPNDFVEAIVKAYQIEVEAGIKLINEYRAMLPHLMPDIDKEDNRYATPMLVLASGKNELSINSYIEQVRMKYWRALFKDKRITGQMTSNLRDEFSGKVEELKDYEFSVYNIKTLQVEMSRHLVEGIEDCIISLFDELTQKHSWYPECEKNIHYYNGWATNKAWIINKKVIIPLNAWDWCKRYNPDDFRTVQKLSDINKALDYLDRGLTADVDMNVLRHAEATGQTKNIHLKYFDITFYKKGTCHITFTNEEVLKKLNIFGSQKKGWLPPSYGKKRYSEMAPEEKSVVEEFEGKDSYEKVFANIDMYLFDASETLLLEEKSA